MFHPDNIHKNQILVSVWLWNFFKVGDRGGFISENNGRFSNYPKNAIKDWRLKKLTTLILIFLLIKCLIFNQIFSGILPQHIFVEKHE